jgi:hypothetical protein
MAKVSIVTEGPAAGVWVTNDKGDTVGLVAEDGKAAYLMIKDGSSQLPFAISTDASREAQIQIPGPNGGAPGVHVYSVEELVKLIKG